MDAVARERAGRPAAMTPKDRVMGAIAHREPDRVPIDFGATMETTIHVDAYDLLKRRIGICTDRPIETKLLTAQFAEVDREVQEYVGADVRGTNPLPPEEYEISTDGGYLYLEDEFGIRWRRPVSGGFYFDMYRHPLAEAEVDDMRAYPFPDPRDERRFLGLEQKIRDRAEGGRYPVVFDNCFGNGIFQTCNQLMGYDQFMMALALREDRAFYLLDKVVEMKMEFWDEALTRFGADVDIVKELDDMGTQLNLMISPDMYRQCIKPRLARLMEFIAARAPHVKLMMHSCGSIRKIIPDLIEVGIEILNPIQYTASDMDPAALKAEFGRDLTFWGGAVETQRTLPSGTVQDVRNETRRQLDILMPGGGFVFAQVHTIQWGVPVDNMLAMWETAREFGTYL